MINIFGIPCLMTEHDQSHMALSTTIFRHDIKTDYQRCNFTSTQLELVVNVI